MNFPSRLIFLQTMLILCKADTPNTVAEILSNLFNIRTKQNGYNIENIEGQSSENQRAPNYEITNANSQRIVQNNDHVMVAPDFEETKINDLHSYKHESHEAPHDFSSDGVLENVKFKILSEKDPLQKSASQKQMRKRKTTLFAGKRRPGYNAGGFKHLGLPDQSLASLFRLDYSGGSFYRPLHKSPQNSPSSLASIISALTMIARYDDYQCLPRMVCEAAAGSASHAVVSSLPPQTMGLQALLTFLTAYISTSNSPLNTIGRAVMMGISFKNHPEACQPAYPHCPTDPQELFYYLNNHNGGLYRFFTPRNQQQSQYPAQTQSQSAKSNSDDMVRKLLVQQNYYNPSYGIIKSNTNQFPDQQNISFTSYANSPQDSNGFINPIFGRHGSNSAPMDITPLTSGVSDDKNHMFFGTKRIDNSRYIKDSDLYKLKTDLSEDPTWTFRGNVAVKNTNYDEKPRSMRLTDSIQNNDLLAISDDNMFY